jgi:hypothetical protein
MTTEVKDVLDRLLHFHFNNVEEYRGGPTVQMDKASLREANALFVEAHNALRAAESRATAAEGRVALLEEERDEQQKIIAAFVQRFELYVGPNDMHAGKHDLELLTLARARLAKGGQS